MGPQRKARSTANLRAAARLRAGNQGAAQDYFESTDDIKSCVEAMAAELGLQVVERKSGMVLGVYAFSPMGLEGRVDGMPFGATIAHRFASLMWGATAMVAIDVSINPPLWADLSLAGRTTPLYVEDDFLAEFEIQTTDRRFADGLVDKALKRTLLDANWAGFYPKLTAGRVSVNASGLGSRRELRESVRFATRIAKLLDENRQSSARSRVHARVAEAWLTAAGHFGGKLDEQTLELGLELPYGHLRLRAAHPAYKSWRTELMLELDPPISGDLRVTTYSGNWERWFAPDIKFGDEDFDGRFLVRSSSRELAERVLSRSARQTLLALSKPMPELLITENGIGAGRAGVLDSLVDTKDALTKAMACAEELLRQRETRSAYR